MNCNISCTPEHEQKEKKNHDPGGYIKVWAMVGFAAIKAKNSGGWRAWQICKHLDQEGSSKVSVLELWAYLSYLKIGERKSFRWVKQALKLGLLTFDDRTGNYYMAGLAQAAVILGCERVGLPAVMRLDAFIKTGWRAHLWSAYLATTNNKLISQATKAKLTGVKARTQYRYQSRLPGGARRNYSQTNFTNDQLQGISDQGISSAFAGRNGKVFIRLPDIRTVPMDIARTLNKGRSKKAQKQINISLNVERDKTTVYRLFFEEYKNVMGALKKIRKSDRPSWELPDEIFRLALSCKNSNIWKPIPVMEGQSTY